ncbi:MAG: phosphoadenosine phosphosulfate reductase family protein [Gammaproteobacteria bacterium]|nr:phosphoadenosine phosphosulfate reductase family protein [Gammaproteobacteria bacterium]
MKNAAQEVSSISSSIPKIDFCQGADLKALSLQFRDNDPADIIQSVIYSAQNPVVFTNFRPLAVAFLHLVARIKADIPVIWVDHGYNTKETYAHVEKITKLMNLNLHTYVPKMTTAHYRALYGEVPPLDTPEHNAFSQTVKLEPFNRAMGELKPDVWLNGIRHDQNTYRHNLDIFTHGNHNTIRVAPMFYLKKHEVEKYVADNGLPDNDIYFDPTKGEEYRECGLLLQK